MIAEATFKIILYFLLARRVVQLDLNFSSKMSSIEMHLLKVFSASFRVLLLFINDTLVNVLKMELK